MKRSLVIVVCLLLTGCSAANMPGGEKGVAVYYPASQVSATPIEKAYGPTFHSLENAYPQYKFN